MSNANGVGLALLGPPHSFGGKVLIMTTESEARDRVPADSIEMPAATSWPFIMAVSVTLIAAGIVTNLALTFAGIVVFLMAAAGWAWAVFAHGGGHEVVEFAPPEQRPRPVQQAPGHVEALRAGMPGHRMRIPEKIHPYSAGVKGGLFGAVTMTIPATIYGIVSGHGIFLPLNLLAGMVTTLPQTADGKPDILALQQFRWSWLIVGALIHGITSVSLGLMYGVILPMLPGRPILWGGLVAPLLWTGATYGFMGVLNPDLNQVVDWPSFVAAQFVYGLTVGIVVVRSEQVYVSQ
jgi:hypothetical protein